MMDCHRRIERFLTQLLEVIETRCGGRLTADERVSFETALRYFRNGVPLHGVDEEESLFPRMRSSGNPVAQATIQTVRELALEHRTVEETHSAIDLLGRRWLALETLSNEDAAILRGLANGLAAVYRHHIDVEDNEVFVAAEQALDEREIEGIGREMAARRGLDYDHLPSVPRCAQRRTENAA